MFEATKAKPAKRFETSQIHWTNTTGSCKSEITIFPSLILYIPKPIQMYIVMRLCYVCSVGYPLQCSKIICKKAPFETITHSWPEKQNALRASDRCEMSLISSWRVQNSRTISYRNVPGTERHRCPIILDEANRGIVIFQQPTPSKQQLLLPTLCLN